jgi:bifunctional UDP-N-acetylglucosamine pyrophosphorylase/glucosamine-1-phosphate N-acetyltransferase
MRISAIILAAGHGTRMRSTLPKVLHRIAGQPFIQYTLDAVASVSNVKPVMVVGHGASAVRETVGDQAEFVIQAEQLGTAHAVQMGEPVLAGNADLVLVVNGDLPLLKPDSIQALVEAKKQHQGAFSMLTVISDNPRGFGRIIRDLQGNVSAIVEEAQATPEQLKVKELNVGAYCFDGHWLWNALRKVKVSPKGEYYLTDLIEIAVEEERSGIALPTDDITEAIGINTRVHLAEAEAVMRRRIAEKWMLSGVTIINPDNTYIDPTVEIGQDTIIYPNTYLKGNTVIGSGCEIGPNAMIIGSTISNYCQVLYSVLEYARLDDYANIGPFGHLRKGAHLGEHVHMGNFGEVKNSYLGPGTKMGHFSYLGDTVTGKNVNIGAGTITCNFDGVNKFKTEIGDNVFIGSDTMLVAPVKIGDNAKTGAGAVVTRDVEADETVVGVPARKIQKME